MRAARPFLRQPRLELVPHVSANDPCVCNCRVLHDTARQKVSEARWICSTCEDFEAIDASPRAGTITS